jgi:hypothetical protein
MDRNWTPSIVPNGPDQTFYIVVNNYGKLGPAFAETDVGEADLETTITDLMSGQYSDPVRVVAFNTSEHWAEDASEDVAREIMRRLDLRDRWSRDIHRLHRTNTPRARADDLSGYCA